MNRFATLVVLLGPLAAEAQRSAAVEAQCYQQTSHAEARACLEIEAHASAHAVHEAEAGAMAELNRWNEEASHKARAIAALKESSTAFSHLRTRQCSFQASLAAGGDGATDRRLLCEIELNKRRVAELQESLTSLR